jgi:CrcB protein
VTPLLFLAVAAAGGAGAALRFVVDGVVRTRIRSAYPVGIAIINVTGSFLLGLVTGLALTHLVSEQWLLVLGTGLLGGYTTFSTASLDTVRLLQSGRMLAALVNGIGMLAASVALATLGLWLGSSAGV